MRLIDADALREDVLSWENCYNGYSDAYDKARIIDAIDEMPTVDIIRCKDCKQWDAELGCCTSYTIVKCTDGREGVSSEADDFCSRGERR